MDSRGLVAAALLLALALAGCTGGPRDAPGYDPSAHGVPVDGAVDAAAVIVTGLAEERRGGRLEAHLGAPSGVAPWPALVVAGARVGGEQGTLVLRGAETHLEGPLAWTLDSVALSGDNLTGFLRADPTGPREGLGEAPAGQDPQAWREHSDALFFSDPLALRASGPVTVNADAVTLATPAGLRELGSGAVVEGGTWRATARTSSVEPPAPVAVLAAPGPRVQVALAEPRGTLHLQGRPDLALAQAAVLDGRAPEVRLSPGPGVVRAAVRLVAFQVYHGGEPVLPARVVVEPAEATVALQQGRGAAALRVREASGDADAVFQEVRASGPGNVTMPGFQSVWESWPPELRLLMFAGPWAIDFIIAEVVLEGMRLITGQYLPQPLRAGQQKEVTVSIEGAQAGEAAVLLEGRNFPEARAALHLR